MKLRQTFLIFQSPGDKQAIYEVSIKLLNSKYVLTTTKDLILNGIPISSNTSVRPYITRQADTLEEILPFFNAYVKNLLNKRSSLHGQLINLIEN
jgi:hypothetical protein